MNTRLLPLSVLLGFSVTFLGASAASWSPPTAAAPSNNTSAPIHTGPASQVKSGTLGVGALSLQGDAKFGASGHLNWGTTQGANGYGLRSEAGIMQYKNNGDLGWTPFSGGGGVTATQQYGYTNEPTWSICLQPSLNVAPNTNNVICEVIGTNAQAVASGWTQETSGAGYRNSGGLTVLSKVIPGQTSTNPWKVCTMNGYTTPYDHQTVNFVLKKPAPDNRWYVYFGAIGADAINISESVIANCWR